LDVRGNPLFREERLYRPEWRETVLLLAGVLYHQGIDRVDAMMSAVLDTLGSPPSLADRAQCVGLLGAAVADLSPVNYQPADKRYRQTLDAVMAIFQPDSNVPIEQAIAAADALGQAGDPRFAPRNRADNWVTIPAGEFWMGAQKTDPVAPNYDPEAYEPEAPVHKVRLAEYCIGRYPVTVAEYSEFIRNDGYQKQEYWTSGGFGEFREPENWEEQVRYPTRPVVDVSWYEAAAYAVWAGGRLPTEAEWERAARGSDGRKFLWGDDEPDPLRMNYADDERTPHVGHPTPVGVYAKGLSPEGLVDMSGNVGEWCQDWFGDYPTEQSNNPIGPAEGRYRVARGGGWGSHAWHCRASCRPKFDPAYRVGLLGFRVVRTFSGGQDS
jgi:formylglycine-generating enzyme required for sulfatase activity